MSWLTHPFVHNIYEAKGLSTKAELRSRELLGAIATFVQQLCRMSLPLHGADEIMDFAIQREKMNKMCRPLKP